MKKQKTQYPFILKHFSTFFFTLLLLFFSQKNYAQAPNGSVRGYVYDKTTGEAMPFANVFLKNTTNGTQTDINGFYSLSRIPTGSNVTVVSTFVGYDTTYLELQLKAGEVINQKIYLTEKATVLQDVVISAEKEEAKTEVRTSVIKITPKQMGKIPTVGGEPDLAQYLQILPGVVSTGDQGGQLYIRGGSPIQTKVLLDGITVYNPFHSLGLFSVFETDVIRNVDVMTGGFGADYSGRISAMIDVTTRDGNKKRHAGKISSNTFLSKGLIEGPIVRLKDDGRGLSGSYILSAKTSYLDKTSKSLYSYVNDSLGLPYKFTDFYGKIAFDTDNGSKISFSAYSNSDRANFLNTADFGWNAAGAALNFTLIPGQSKSIIDGFFSYSNYAIKLQESADRPRNSSIGGFNGGINFSYFMPHSFLKYGIEVSGFSTTFKFPSAAGYFLEDNQYTTELGGYVKYRQNVKSRLVLEPSVRTTFYASLGAFAFEPRLGFKYNITENMRLKGSAGVYTQNFISTKSDKDVVNLFTGFLSAPDENLYDIKGNLLKANIQNAKHAILGLEYDVAKNLDVNIEGYYKKFGNQININREKYYISDPDFIVETGDAYGVDFLAKFQNKQWFIWGVYSLAYVTRNNGSQVYYPHFDRRHNVNFVANYSFGKNLDWEVGLRWNLGSGFPFTRTQGFYESVNFSEGIDVNYLQQNGSLGIIYEDKINGGRLSYYHRLDLSAKKTFKLSKNSHLEINASLTNAYNRQNIFYFDRVRFTTLNQLPILPSAGLSLTF